MHFQLSPRTQIHGYALTKSVSKESFTWNNKRIQNAINVERYTALNACSLNIQALANQIK